MEDSDARRVFYAREAEKGQVISRISSPGRTIKPVFWYILLGILVSVVAWGWMTGVLMPEAKAASPEFQTTPTPAPPS